MACSMTVMELMGYAMFAGTTTMNVSEGLGFGPAWMMDGDIFLGGPLTWEGATNNLPLALSWLEIL